MQIAKELFAKAAEQGYIDSMFNLAEMLKNEDNEEAKAQAIDLYRQAAAKGHIWSKNNLAASDRSDERYGARDGTAVARCRATVRVL